MNTRMIRQESKERGAGRDSELMLHHTAEKADGASGGRGGCGSGGGGCAGGNVVAVLATSSHHLLAFPPLIFLLYTYLLPPALSPRSFFLPASCSS